MPSPGGAGESGRISSPNARFSFSTGRKRDERRGQADATKNQTAGRAETEPESDDPERRAGDDRVDNGNNAGNREKRLSYRNELVPRSAIAAAQPGCRNDS